MQHPRILPLPDKFQFNEQFVGDDALGVPSTKPTSMGGFVAFFIVLLGFWGIEPQNPRWAVEGASPYDTPTNRNLKIRI